MMNAALMVCKLRVCKKQTIFFLVLTAGLTCLTANAQEAQTPQPAKSNVLGTRKTTLNFEDELVEGGTQKPELFYLFQKKNFNYKRLIKVRENFIPEMRQTAEDLQHFRGGR